jgi:transposase
VGIRDRRAIWATRKNLPDLTCEQRSSLAEIVARNSTLYKGRLSWASHTRIREFVARARSLRRYRELVHNTLDHGLSNARSEAPTPTCGH